MSNEYRQLDRAYDTSPGRVSAASRFINKVYGWMTVGLGMTAVCAWMATSWMETLAPEQLASYSKAILLLFLIEIGLVFAISMAINRISAFTAGLLFVAYSALSGVTLAPLLLAYSQQTVTNAFVAAAVTFGGMSLFGFVTRRDLSGLGGFLIMALWGLIAGTIINLFWANSTLYWLITYVGIAIFIGLTAYDTQRIKQMAGMTEDGSLAGEAAGKAAIIGALALYLDFINLFILMLRLFSGGNRN